MILIHGIVSPFYALMTLVGYIRPLYECHYYYFADDFLVHMLEYMCFGYINMDAVFWCGTEHIKQ